VAKGQFINYEKAGIRTANYSARAADFFSDYTNGMTLDEIGKKHGITRERVRQIMTKIYGRVSCHGGGAIKAAKRAKQDIEAMDEKSLKLRGCTFAQYQFLRDHPDKPTIIYGSQRNNSKQRGIEWKFNLWTWWTAWQDSGKWPRRGRTVNDYVMARFLDYGPYSPDNVYFITASNNSKSIGTNRSLKGIPLKHPNKPMRKLRSKTFRAPKVPKTHCRNGHEYNGDNTRILKTGLRQCRICDRNAKKKIYHMKKIAPQLQELPT
jgi:Sigma-70, region 4